MAKQPKDSLRFKVLDVLNRKGTLQHREITEHLRLEPDRILTELERMKADAEVVQNGARGPFTLTQAGKEAVRAFLTEPGDVTGVDAVLAIAQRIGEKEAEKATIRQRHEEKLAAATSGVEAAARLLAEAQAALNDVRLAQHNEEADLEDEIQVLRASLAKRVR